MTSYFQHLTNKIYPNYRQKKENEEQNVERIWPYRCSLNILEQVREHPAETSRKQINEYITNP